MDYFLGIAKQALFLALIITAPPVLVAMIVGLVIILLSWAIVNFVINTTANVSGAP